MRAREFSATCALILAAGAPARAQVTVGSDAELEIGGRLELQAATSSCTEFPPVAGSPCAEQAPAVDWFLRRARIAVEFRVDEDIDGKLEPDFGDLDGVTLADAWGRIRVHQGIRLKVGHFKKPFDGFQLTSSSRMLTIERDLDVPGVPGAVALSYDELTTRARLSDRDLGLELGGDVPGAPLRFRVGAFNGREPSANGDLNTDKQWLARLEAHGRVGGLPARIAVSGALTDLPFEDPDGRTRAEHFSAAEVFAELGGYDETAWVQAGLVRGENPLRAEGGGAPDLAAGDPLATMTAVQVMAGWRIAVPDGGVVRGLRPVARWSLAEPDGEREDDEVTATTLGVQLLLAGRSRVAVNWDRVSFADERDPEWSFKAHYLLYF